MDTPYDLLVLVADNPRLTQALRLAVPAGTPFSVQECMADAYAAQSGMTVILVAGEEDVLLGHLREASGRSPIPLIALVAGPLRAETREAVYAAGAWECLALSDVTVDILTPALECAGLLGQRVKAAILDSAIQAQRDTFPLLVRLARGIAHEFSNQATAIMGSAELLAINSHGANTDLHTDRLRIACRKVATLFEQLSALPFSGPGRHTDLGLLLRQSEPLLRQILPRQVALDVQVEASYPKVTAEAATLELLLLNLLLEGSRRVEGHGRLRVRLGTVRGQEDLAVLEVTPAPCGADAVSGARFCEAARHLTQSLGASFDADMTSLRVTFGLVQARPDPSRCLVLLADDESRVRTVGARMLRHLGYDVVEAEDGTKAVEQLERYGDMVKLALLDMSMPGLSGDRCAQRLKELHPRLRVLLTTGHECDDELGTMLEKGIDGLLQKPYCLDDLEQLLRLTLSEEEL